MVRGWPNFSLAFAEIPDESPGPPTFPFPTVSSIADESLRQVLAATDVVDLIGQYVTLKKAGPSHKGLCPFHPEKTPSFNVSQSKQSYHCFGCHKGGDAISFVRDHLNMPFLEAVRFLARRANIVLVEEASNPAAESAHRAKSRLIKLHNDAAKWMHELLLKQGGEGPQTGRDYMKKRGLDKEVAKRWLIGYAPEDPRMWREWARSKGYDAAVMIEGGLFAARLEGQPEQGTYARFRHRIMFPVRNDQGDVIAFSGRLLDPEQKGGKYINSPETPIFNKSQVLFGWDKTRRAITKADCAIVCEGQIDLITAVEHGIENIVAPLGTALTEHHARMLRRAASQVILCYDADNAGYKAAKRGFQLLAPEGMFIRVAKLPPGEDPDSMIRQKGPDAFRESLDQATDFFEFQIEQQSAALLPGKDLEKSKLAGELAENLVLLSDKIAQDTAINRCSTRLNVPSGDIRLLVSREQKKLKREADNKKEAEKRFGSRPDRPAATVGKVTPETFPAGSAEADGLAVAKIDNWALRHLVRLALTDEETLNFLHEQASSGEHPWRGYSGGDVLDRILGTEFIASDPASLNSLLATLPPSHASIVTGLLHERSPKKDDFLAAQGSFYRLQYDNNRRQQQLITQKLRAVGNDMAAMTSALQELTRLKREQVDLEQKLPKVSAEG